MPCGTTLSPLSVVKQAVAKQHRLVYRKHAPPFQHQSSNNRLNNHASTPLDLVRVQQHVNNHASTPLDLLRVQQHVFHVFHVFPPHAG